MDCSPPGSSVHGAWSGLPVPSPGDLPNPGMEQTAFKNWLESIKPTAAWILPTDGHLLTQPLKQGLSPEATCQGHTACWWQRWHRDQTSWQPGSSPALLALQVSAGGDPCQGCSDETHLQGHGEATPLPRSLQVTATFTSLTHNYARIPSYFWHSRPLFWAEHNILFPGFRRDHPKSFRIWLIHTHACPEYSLHREQNLAVGTQVRLRLGFKKLQWSILWICLAGP